jgi:hypothetical protein
MSKQLANRTDPKWIHQVLTQFNSHEISEVQACEYLQIGRSRLYAIRKDWLKAQIKGTRFELSTSGEGQKRSLTDTIQRFLHKELSYIATKAKFYRGRFNFAFISEKILDKFGVNIHRNTIRRFAIQKRYYRQTTQEIRKPCVRFEMNAIGALFQHDTSRHVWLPCSGRYHDVLMTKDDHSRLVTGFSLREIESAWEHIRLARSIFEKYGCPLAYYVDRHNIFKLNLASSSIHYTVRISEEEGKVQFKRALNSVDISVLYAQDAKSKGKIEKQFDYFQRRLPTECERYRVKTIKEAMKILTDLVFFYNEKRIHLETQEIPIQRWKRAIHEKRSKLRPLPKNKDLDVIFSLHYPRSVANDGSFRFHNKLYRIGQYPGKLITVAFIPNKKLMAIYKEQKIWQCHYENPS